MAIGDAAVLAGMAILTGSEPANTIDTEINKTRDYIADRTSTVTPVAKGGTGATTAAAARANLGAPAAGTLGGNAVMDIDGTGKIGFRWNGRRFSGRNDGTEVEIAHLSDAIAAQSTADSAASAAASVAGVADGARNGYLTPAVYARTLGGSYRVAYVNSDGVLGWVSSSRRHKKNIRPAEVDPAAVLALQLVTFLYKAEIDREGITQWGFIAEQAADLGLDWLVDYGADGEVEGFRYDRFALALLPVVQDLTAQHAALAARVAALEARLS